MTQEEIFEVLQTLYPFADPEFIRVCLQAMKVHNDKTADYISALSRDERDLPNKSQRVMERFFSIRRKYIRLFNAVINQKKMMVDESIEDTCFDLGVFAFMFIAKNRKEGSCE